MIHAAQAAALQQESDKSIIEYVEALEPRIREAAEKGKREMRVFAEQCRVGDKKPELTIRWDRIIQRLKGFGYRTKWGQLDAWRERGPCYGDLDDSEHKEQVADFGLEIYW